jgi:hypothetical protein
MSGNYKSSYDQAVEPVGKNYAALRKGRASLTLI